MTNILVAYDFSPAADHALDWAVAQQRAVGGAIRVIHVINPMPLYAAASPIFPLPSRDAVADAEHLLRARVANLGVPATADVILSPASVDVILHEASGNRADLIVMGTHGRAGISRMVLGSVAELVVRNASCPVVTVHAA